MMQRGIFVVFEGIDGSGKSTQAVLLAQALENMGRRVHCTAEPTTGPAGLILRAHLQGRSTLATASLLPLFHADRMEHLHNAQCGILNRLERGEDVVCDRYLMSTYVYQGVLCDFERQRMAVIKAMNNECRLPDLTFFLKVTPEEGMRRKCTESAGSKLDVFESLDQQTRFAAVYEHACWQYRAEHNVVDIDGAQPLSACAAEILERARVVVELCGSWPG